MGTSHALNAPRVSAYRPKLELRGNNKRRAGSKHARRLPLLSRKETTLSDLLEFNNAVTCRPQRRRNIQ